MSWRSDTREVRENPPEGCVDSCPGCAHRSLSRERSTGEKQAWLDRALAPWKECISPLRDLPDARRWHYRDKVCLSCRWQDDRWQIGLLQRDHVIAIPECPVHSRRVKDAIAVLLPALPPADEFPLHYWAQCGAQLTLVVKTKQLPDTDWFNSGLAEALREARLDSLWLHCYPAAGRHAFTRRGWHLLWGDPVSRDADGLRYGPTGFQQLIPDLYRQALAEAEDFLEPDARSDLVDLYCGNGASLRRWRERGARCMGVEAGAEAVEHARINAPGAEILRGYCAQRIPQLRQWLESTPGETRRRLLHVNPPRTGLEEEIISWILSAARPQRIAYLSCSAGTLRRDLENLSTGGYHVVRITPYDFFPQTYHVETLALLTLRE